jgi:phage terminase large subunit-like protein
MPQATSETNIDLNKLGNLNLDEMKSALCLKSFHYFVKTFWGEKSGDVFVDAPHIKYLCDRLQAIGVKLLNNEPCEKGLVVNVAPGSSKSTIISEMFNAWLWAHNPAIEIISASNTINISKESNRKTLAIITSDKYEKYFPWVVLGDTQNIQEFTTTKHGKRYCTSVGSSIRGVHGMLLIADDLDSIETATNELERKKLQEWITGTFLTRKSDNLRTFTIFVQQRLGALDSSNFLLETGNYEHICLPAEYNERIVQPKSAKVLYDKDGILNPLRCGRKVLDQKRAEMLNGPFNAQYGQNPAGEGDDGIVHKEWIPVISRLDFDKLVYNKHYVVNYYCDPAFTTNQKRNDPSAILACSTVDNILYVLNVERVWLETPELMKFIKTFVYSNGYSPRSIIMCEPKGPGLSLIPALRSQLGLNVVPGTAYNRHHGDKAYRLSAITPFIQSKRVVLIDGKYVRGFLDEVTSIDSKHDDQKDVFSMAVNDALAKPKGYGKLNFSIAHKDTYANNQRPGFQR